MAKLGMYKKVNFTISHTNSRGRYKIEADYYRTHVVAFTNDSEAYDYLDDEDHPKQQREAIMHCYCKIVEAYKKL